MTASGAMTALGVRRQPADLMLFHDGLADNIAANGANKGVIRRETGQVADAANQVEAGKVVRFQVIQEAVNLKPHGADNVRDNPGVAAGAKNDDLLCHARLLPSAR